jgi:hypothetical protein
MKDDPVPQTVNLTLHVDAGEEADADELDRVTRQLLDELQELEVESAELVSAEGIPEGTKSAEAVTLGALAVAVLPAAVEKLIEFLKAWSLRGEGRKMKIKTEVGDRSVELEYSPSEMSPSEVKQLVETLVETLVEENDSD